MAPGYKRAHAEFFSNGESLVVAVPRHPKSRGIFVRGDLSKQLESISLVCLSFGLTGERSLPRSDKNNHATCCPRPDVVTVTDIWIASP